MTYGMRSSTVQSISEIERPRKQRLEVTSREVLHLSIQKANQAAAGAPESVWLQGIRDDVSRSVEKEEANEAGSTSSYRLPRRSDVNGSDRKWIQPISDPFRSA